jgi:hypothetical protein
VREVSLLFRRLQNDPSTQLNISGPMDCEACAFSVRFMAKYLKFSSGYCCYESWVRFFSFDLGTFQKMKLFRCFATFLDQLSQKTVFRNFLAFQL